MHAHESAATAAGRSHGLIPDVNSASVSETGQYVAFSSGGRSYAVDIMSVNEIRSWSPTTGIPGQHPASIGVMDIRGEVIEVYDLSALLGSDRTVATEGHVVLVLAINATMIGILVDAVSDIMQVGVDKIQPPPGDGTKGGRRVVSGLVKQNDRIVAILDLSRAIGSSN